MADAARRLELEIATDESVRPERLAASRLRSYVLECERNRVWEGAASFDVAGKCYARDLNAFQGRVEIASGQLTNAFAFMDEAFGDGREMNAFVAEIASRPASAGFVSTFGSESYYAHDGAVVATSGKSRLLSRVEEFDLQAALAAQAQADAESTRSCGGCSGC